MNDNEHTAQAPTPTDSPIAAGGNDNPAPADRWSALGFTPADGGGYLTPADLVVFEISDAGARAAMVQTLMHMGEPPRLNVKVGAAEQTFFRLDHPDLAATLKRSVPAGVHVRTGGDTIQLPDTAAWATPASFPATAADLSAITAVEVSRIAKADLPTAQPLIERTPLTAMSLRGLSAEFRARAVEAKPLLADLCFSGQVTTWYAAPNTGKTLITLNLLVDAVREGRVTGGNVYYINADDGSDGIATKMEILDPLEVHTLVPGFREFNPIELAGKLTKMGVREQSRGVFVIIDTTKKFASLMDKREATAFGTACRQVAMNGGAVLNLAHTTKNPNADGTPRYSGTTDLLEDADAAYTIAKVDSGGEAGERVVEFKCFKQRGPNAETAAYAYDAAPDTSYLDRFASVRRVELRDATRALQGVTVSARRGDEQNKWLGVAAIGGVVVGMIVWAVFAGVVARSVPAGWQWPERMAARTLDMPMWEGGQRMMRTAAPDAFANIAAADRIVIANRKALEACSKRAIKMREAVSCTMRIAPDEQHREQ